MFWCFGVSKSASPQFRPGWKVVFFTIFADYDGWEAEKSRNKIFCVKNVDYLPNHKVFSVKMYLKSSIRQKKCITSRQNSTKWLVNLWKFSQFRQFYPYPETLLPFYVIFSCPQQLNRWPCHSLTDWVIHSLTFTFEITERPQRLVTFETFDQSDEETWPDQHFDNFFWQFWQFLTIFDIFDNFWHSLTFFDNNWHFSTIFNNFNNFDKFRQFWQI